MVKEIIHDGEMAGVTYHDGVYQRSLCMIGEYSSYIRGERHPVYDGEISLIPKARSDIVLETKDKIVKDDITVTKFPFYSTENPSGVEKDYIAKE